MLKFQAKRANPAFTIYISVNFDGVKVSGFGSGRSGEFFKAGNLLSPDKIKSMGGIVAASQSVKATIRKIHDAANGDPKVILAGLNQSFPENGNWHNVIVD